jgi:hypothetical protein
MGNKFIHLNKKIDDLDSKVNKRIDVLDKKIDNLDIKHSLKFVDLETRIDNCVTKDEFNEFRNETNSNFDKILVILNRLDQERVFTNHRFNRIEKAIGLVGL